ncbi:UDP-N-acetylglucosamine--LPS N-acetylglucosamine transferase [Bradyrhizobium sp. SBR1B]|uniref:UDP-N-acetylglucosamine--LPS N-acetylglucosamine transferase n=1 Tax=Bradyrhizobium sp. SBR1B TaxID=2663836 RepID=UPI0016057B7F|nr:UDP-N-acetylglucosamine--LPS N-acetylglucosamine transferase [Bradyrhizobium sp. SBR1B]MBB4382495.1 UDP-N-acetylglucosamine:LPS N-acetylglucosamine transferase [Bradyrhizobium sp. SBR1B]
MLRSIVLHNDERRSLARSGNRPKLLAVSSGGGHWVQLLRIKEAFEGCEVVFVTVHESYRTQVPDHKFYVVNDANRWTKIRLVKAAQSLARIIWSERPDVVISTGAAPGYLALRLGRMMGARTIWLDSVANVEELSMSGFRIGHCADLWLTQWPHLARPEGPYYGGSVL